MNGRVLRFGVVLAALVVGAGCSGGEGGGAGERREVTVPEVDLVEFASAQPLHGDVVAAGDTLVGWAAVDETLGVQGGHPTTLLRSTDAGEAWEPVTLPNAPPHMSGRVEMVEDVAVVHGRELTPWFGGLAEVEGRYLWLSGDGLTWHGGRIGREVPAGGSDAYEVGGLAPVGDALVAVAVAGTASDQSDPGRVDLLHSTDGGATWTTAATPPIGLEPGGLALLLGTWVTEPERALVALQVLGEGGSFVGEGPVLETTDGGATWRAAECPGERQYDDCYLPADGDRLASLNGRVSVDGGATWHVPEIVSEHCDGRSGCYVEDAVAGAGGGWLGEVAYGQDVELPSALLWSSDGVRWVQVDPALSDDCPTEDGAPEGSAAPALGYGEVTPVGDGWLVGYRCNVDGRAHAGLVAVGPDGAASGPVPGAAVPEGTYHPALRLGDDLVLPAYQDAEGHDEILLTGLLRVTGPG